MFRAIERVWGFAGFFYVLVSEKQCRDVVLMMKVVSVTD